MSFGPMISDKINIKLEGDQPRRVLREKSCY